MKKKYIYVIITILLWATSGICTKLLGENLTSMQILSASVFFASISLIGISLFQKKSKIIKSYKFKDYLKFIVFGFIGIFLYTYLFNSAILVLPVQEAFIINYLWPIMVMVFSVIILKDKFNIYKLIALLISFFGVIVIATKGDLFSMKFDNLTGVLMDVGAAICGGLFFVLIKKSNYENTTSMMFYHIAAFIISIIYLKFNFPIITLKDLLLLIWIGAFTKGIAYFTWGLAIQSEDSAKLANFAFITPVISTIFSVIFLKEKLYVYFIIGLVLILSGVFFQSLMNKENK